MEQQKKSFSCQEWKILRTNLKWWEKVYLLLCGTLNKESCKPQEHLKSKEILSDFKGVTLENLNLSVYLPILLF